MPTPEAATETTRTDATLDVEPIAHHPQRKLGFEQFQGIIEGVPVRDGAHDACAVSQVGRSPTDHARFNQHECFTTYGVMTCEDRHT